MRYPNRTLLHKERLQVANIDDVRNHPSTEPTVAAVATRHLERLAHKYGATVEGLLAYVRTQAAKEARAKAEASSFFRSSPSGSHRRGMEWHDRINPPPYTFFETSAAHDGPPREGVTAITIISATLAPRTYVWNGTGFTKPKTITRRWNLIRSVPIDNLEDLLSHLKTLTPFEHVVLGKPAQDTPQLAKQKLSAKKHGDLRTILDTSRPYIICDCDNLPNLENIDVSTLTPVQIHRYAVGNLPEEFRAADCLMFFSGSHGTSLGKVKVHLWFWLSKPIKETFRKLWLTAINVSAGGEEDDDEDTCTVDTALAQPAQAIFAAAPTFRRHPDPVKERWHFITGTTREVAVPEREVLERILKGRRPRPVDGSGSGGAGGSTGGWVGILESMGDANGNGFHKPQKMAIGLYVRQYGATCDPQPFYEVFDALIDARATVDRDRNYADGRKADARSLMAFTKSAEAQKGRPAARKRTKPPTPPTLDEAGRQLREALSKIVDDAIAEAIAGSIRRVAKAALRRGRGARLENLELDQRLISDPALRARLEKVAKLERVEPQARAFPVGLGVGKTHEGLLQLARAVKAAGLGLAYHGATHELLREVKARLEAIDPGLRVEVWHGESAEAPDGAAACPRHEERSLLRANGGDAMALCGSPNRGFCRYHPEKATGARHVITGASVRTLRAPILCCLPAAARCPTCRRNGRCASCRPPSR